jgi:hypothetical protein
MSVRRPPVAEEPHPSHPEEAGSLPAVATEIAQALERHDDEGLRKLMTPTAPPDASIPGGALASTPKLISCVFSDLSTGTNRGRTPPRKGRSPRCTTRSRSRLRTASRTKAPAAAPTASSSRRLATSQWLVAGFGGCCEQPDGRGHRRSTPRSCRCRCAITPGGGVVTPPLLPLPDRTAPWRTGPAPPRAERAFFMPSPLHARRAGRGSPARTWPRSRTLPDVSGCVLGRAYGFDRPEQPAGERPPS